MTILINNFKNYHNKIKISFYQLNDSTKVRTDKGFQTLKDYFHSL